mgnify:CR=1 FL=1
MVSVLFPGTDWELCMTDRVYYIFHQLSALHLLRPCDHVTWRPCDRATMRLTLNFFTNCAGLWLSGIFFHSVPAPEHGWHFVFYKYVTASRLFRHPVCGVRRPVTFALFRHAATGVRSAAIPDYWMPVAPSQSRIVAKSPPRQVTPSLHALRPLPFAFPHALRSSLFALRDRATWRPL